MISRGIICGLVLSAVFICNSGEAVDLNDQDFRLDAKKIQTAKSEGTERIVSKKTRAKSKKSAKASTKKSSGGRTKSGAAVTSVLGGVEEEYQLPSGLLCAIAKIESNFNPNAVNVSGRGHYFNTPEEAVEFVEARLEEGKKNISIGCVQLLYVAHKRAFGNSVKAMFDVQSGGRYAAEYLKSLYRKYGSWEVAVARYHSPNAQKGKQYCAKVSRNMKEPIFQV